MERALKPAATTVSFGHLRDPVSLVVLSMLAFTAAFSDFPLTLRPQSFSRAGVRESHRFEPSGMSVLGTSQRHVVARYCTLGAVIDDVLYADEMHRLCATGVLDLRLALSREPGVPKMYVQDKMLDDCSEICELISPLQ